MRWVKAVGGLGAAAEAVGLFDRAAGFVDEGALARLREMARQRRRTAWTMQPSPARSALERLALRREVIAEAERRRAERTSAANDA